MSVGFSKGARPRGGICDNAEGIDSIAWTPYGKVRAVFKDDNSEVRFRYDAAGNRIAKITDSDTTIYVRDASEDRPSRNVWWTFLGRGQVAGEALFKYFFVRTFK